jgi:GNAT superfamily N-acetyltransferase
MDLLIDRLTSADLAAALRLSTQAGWNQIEADWRRLLGFSPQGCFAGRLEGRLVATVTVVSYGRDAHWIGMALVDEAFRGRGFGAAILAKAIEHGLAQGSDAVGLDATDLGRPVYLKQGLVDVATINRWGGVLREGGSARGVELLDRSTFDEVAALDRAAAGVDRSDLLLRLLHEEEVFGWIARDGGKIGGFAFVRPGRDHAHIGPVVAQDADLCARLLERIAAHLRGRSVLIDLLRNEEPARTAGLLARRRLMRMTARRPQDLLRGPWISAATAFEWG